MSTAAELHSQIASIVEVLANSAVAEICKVVEDGYAVVNLEMSRSLKENECLRRRVRLLELQVSRYRAEQRLKSPLEGTVSGRVFPGVRLLHHRTGRDTPTATGSSLQSKSRFLNRSSVSQPQKTPPTDVDQDPSQEVVPVTKTEPTESEEDSDLVIVKVEGSVSVEDHNISNNNTSTPTARTSETQIQSGCKTEGQESQENPTIFWKPEMEKDEGGFRTSPPSEEQSPFTPNWQDQHPKLQQPSNSAYQLKDFPSRPNFNLLHATPASVSRLDSQEVYGSSHHISNSLYRQEDFTPSIVSLENKTNETVEALACKGTQIASLQYHPVLPRTIKQTTFSCVICCQTFAQKSQLRSHEKVHRIENKCAQCGKVFANFCHLKRHKLVHTGERPHLCVQCGKRFSTANNLKVHQSVHTGERKFKCSTCGKSYPFQSSLIRHQALHLK